MSQRAWVVGDWLVRRRDKLRGEVVAIRVHVLYQTLVDGVAVRLGGNCIVAGQSMLEADGWELWKGREQR